MVHDGDQNKTGGDVGQDCVYFVDAGGCPNGNPKPDCDCYSNGYGNRDTGRRSSPLARRSAAADLRRRRSRSRSRTIRQRAKLLTAPVHHLAAGY